MLADVRGVEFECTHRTPTDPNQRRRRRAMKPYAAAATTPLEEPKLKSCARVLTGSARAVPGWGLVPVWSHTAPSRETPLERERAPLVEALLRGGRLEVLVQLRHGVCVSPSHHVSLPARKPSRRWSQLRRRGTPKPHPPQLQGACRHPYDTVTGTYSQLLAVATWRNPVRWVTRSTWEL
jgi:hypothetical protein